MTTKKSYLVLQFDWVKLGGFESWAVVETNIRHRKVFHFERQNDYVYTRRYNMTNVGEYFKIGYIPMGLFTEDQLLNSIYKNFWYGINRKNP